MDSRSWGFRWISYPTPEGGLLGLRWAGLRRATPNVVMNRHILLGLVFGAVVFVF